MATSPTSQNKQYWDTTLSGAFIIPSRTSILETLGKVTASPPKIPPKSTIGAVENVVFHIRQLGSYHPYLASGLLFAAVFGLSVLLRRRMRSIARGSGGGGGGSSSILAGVVAGTGGILNGVVGSAGYFRLDGREGLLNGLGVGGGGGGGAGGTIGGGAEKSD
jgi:protein disulfide-isomerase